MKKYALLFQGCFLIGTECGLVNNAKQEVSHKHHIDDKKEEAIRSWIASLEYPANIANVIYRVRVLEGHLKKEKTVETKEKN